MAFRSARIASVLALALVAGANADVVVFDQIGAGTAATDGKPGYASQDFEASFDAFDIVAIDDFTTTGGTVSRVEGVMGFFNSVTNNYANVTNWRVEFYTSTAAAGANLVGNAGHQVVAPAGVTITTGYTSSLGNSALVSIPVNIALPAGTYWVGIIPVMNFGTGGDPGQIGVSGSTLGDVAAAQANPGAGFGFTTQATQDNFAYRVSMVPAPGSLALLGLGGLAAARRRRR